MWSPQGTETQNAIIYAALNRFDFPWNLLKPGLAVQTGRTTIPVEWEDLSRFSSAAHAAHDHATGVEQVHAIEARGRVLGLFYYSGRVVIDASLEASPELAAEVFGSEGAHAVDVFWMSDYHRTGIWNLVHTGDPDIAPDVHTEHAWFEPAEYVHQVGESFMMHFVESFSDITPTMELTHSLEDHLRPVFREIVLEGALFGLKCSKVYHRNRHFWTRAELHWPNEAAALEAGRRPCRVCFR